MSDVLQSLSHVLAQRKQADPASSYVASLHQQGLNKILEKIGEEATEVILAAKDAEQAKDAEDKSHAVANYALVGEVADLWFHSLVMLSALDLSHNAVLTELERRFDLSGLAEKAQRK